MPQMQHGFVFSLLENCYLTFGDALVMIARANDFYAYQKFLRNGIKNTDEKKRTSEGKINYCLLFFSLEMSYFVRTLCFRLHGIKTFFKGK